MCVLAKSHNCHKHDLIYYILIYIFFNGTEGVICPILLSIFCHNDAVFMPFVQETAGRERVDESYSLADNKFVRTKESFDFGKEAFHALPELWQK